MAYMVPREGDVTLSAELLANGENWLLCLYNAAITPAETDVAATYTAAETAFAGYARKTINRQVGSGAGKWSTPVAQAPSGSPPWSARTLVGHSAYDSANPQTFACSGAGDVIYGYFVLGATSGKLIMAERFATARTLASGDTLAFVPIWEAA